jgi:cell wall-associated NlpC family hydrolase
MAPTTTGKGYWMFAGDGGIFSFGDAAFYGSTGDIKLNQPIIAMSASATGRGYWLLASDGGVFTFGDATFHGSTGAMHLNQPVVGMAPSSDGKGYWLVASDGGLFSFDVPFQGSLGGAGLKLPVTSMLTMPVKSGSGYWLVTSDGTATGFGAAASTGATGTATSTSGTAVPVKPPMYGVVQRVKTRGEAAVNFALGQLGKPYLWGGNGPDSYDCSGLTKAAWSTVGISLPRVANDQYNFGTKVGLDQLLPGDLVFYATDLNDPRSIHHVAIYLGDGAMVEAPYTGANVRISTVQRDELIPFGVRPAG